MDELQTRILRDHLLRIERSVLRSERGSAILLCSTLLYLNTPTWLRVAAWVGIALNTAGMLLGMYTEWLVSRARAARAATGGEHDE